MLVSDFHAVVDGLVGLLWDEGVWVTSVHSVESFPPSDGLASPDPDGLGVTVFIMHSVGPGVSYSVRNVSVELSLSFRVGCSSVGWCLRLNRRDDDLGEAGSFDLCVPGCVEDFVGGVGDFLCGLQVRLEGVL